MKPKHEMPIFKLIDWFRVKMGKPPLAPPPESESGYKPEVAAEIEADELHGDDVVEQDSVEVDLDGREDAGSFQPPSSEKRKKIMVLVGVAGAVLALAVMMSSGDKPVKAPVQRNVVKKEPAKALPPQLDVTSLIEESARQEVTDEKAKRQRELEELKKQMLAEMKKEMQKHDASQSDEQSDVSATIPGARGSAVKTDKQKGVAVYYPPPPGNAPAGSARLRSGGQARVGVAPRRPAIGSSFVVVNGTPFRFERGSKGAVATQSDGEALDSGADYVNDDLDAGAASGELYVPSGSFVRGTILTGADVPAPIGTGKSDPYPVLIHLTEDSFGPNQTHRKIKECFIVASGKGDLSLERALFRTNTLSCEYEDGSKLDTQIKGYVVDSDGRVGLRGRVNQRNGSKIAMTLLAGFGQGFGQAASAAGQVQTVTGAGITTTTDPNSILKNSAYAGVGTAAGKLADHYAKMADAIFPVIEIPAMREVTVVVLSGFSLEPNINKGG